MSEDKNVENLCSTPDIDLYIKNNFKELSKKDLDSFNDSECPNPILKNLLNHAVKKQLININQESIVTLEGNSSIINLYSEKYNKYIVLLGDIHESFVPSQTGVTITEYLDKYFEQNTKLIDLFIEIPFYHKNNREEDYKMKESPLQQTYINLRDCYFNKNCSFRFHAADIRMSIDNTIKDISSCIHVILELLEYLKTNYVWDVDFIKNKYLDNQGVNIFTLFYNKLLENTQKNIGHSIVKRKIEKQINNILDEDIKTILTSKISLYTKEHVEKYTKFSDNFLQNISDVKRPEQQKEFIEKFTEVIRPFHEYDINLVDIYTITRVFRNFSPYKLNSQGERIKCYNPSPKYSIIFLGQSHIDNIYSILVDLGFEVKFGQKRTKRKSYNIQYKNLPHKFFNDKNFLV